MQYLLHAANVVYFFSYTVKDILWLRLLTVAAGACLLAYYYLSPSPLWAAIAWNLLFSAINLYQIYVLLLERRPVRLRDEEHRLYQLVFRALLPREYLRLLRLGRWQDAPASERMVKKGQPLDRVMVIYSGRAAVEVDGRPAVFLTDGQFVGEMSFLTDQHPSADVVAVEPTRYVWWPKAELRKALQHNPELRATIQLVIGTDLVSKLRRG
jgi:hypothetical protein